MYKLIIVLSLLLFVSCGNKQNEIDGKNIKDRGNTKQDDTIRQNRDTLQGSNYELKDYEVIINPTDKEFSDVFGDKYKRRTPDVSDIEIAEMVLSQGVYDQKRGTVDRLLDRKLEEYNRQFVGATDSAGDKIVWINCFSKPEKPNDEWKHKLIIAMGGGNSFFNLKVNVTKNTYTDFFVNGSK